MDLKILQNQNEMIAEEQNGAFTITLKEASEISGYAPDYVGQLIRQGKLPGRQIYSSIAWMTNESAIRQYIKRNQKSKNDGMSNVVRSWFVSGRVFLLIRAMCFLLIAFIAATLLLLFYVFVTSIDYRLQQQMMQTAAMQE